MKLQLLSDLHLETQPGFIAEPAPQADLLVLAGDIGSYQYGSRLGDADFGLRQFSPLPQYGGWPVPVLYVPGNHEYDALDFDETHVRLRQTCDRLGITWLERESLVIDGVRFIGTTLWSDFDALAAEGSLASRLKAREKAFRAANFYLRTTGGTRHGKPWLAEGVREQCQVCRDWLEAALREPFEGSTVAVTHFAPSLRSMDPRYGLTPGTAGFCNSHDDLLAHAQLWLHGHLHAPSLYEHLGCRVVANPLGYAGKGEQDAFRPRAVIEVPARQPAPG
ncbi:metallophosphoesterase [Variovorax sp. VNK109]|jgi:predicted phosphodiesterase|uniref:metallophosphoesterase n=1 Tax=Variovorax sp. VNK109 TaxID=3400919 RepID=UPI003C091DCD